METAVRLRVFAGLIVVAVGVGGTPVRGFDADGSADLVIGVMTEDVNAADAAGAVNVLYGGSTGVGSARNQFWHQDSVGIVDETDPFDWFGSSLAVGDFNGDHFADVAVGADGEGIPAGGAGAGAVQILYGGGAGLAAAGNELWSQDSPDVLDSAEPYDRFGHALATGDFNRDGFDDLAIGVPEEDLGADVDCGLVHVLYGSATGLAGDSNIILHQDLSGSDNAAETGDQFGDALATGDFDGDGFDDLAVGVRGEDNGAVVNAGAVHVFHGGPTGIDPTDDWFFHQNTPGIEDDTEEGDSFGASLASDDFDHDGYDDLAIGVPDEDIGVTLRAGAVNVVYGSAAGLTAAGDQFWHQDLAGLANAAEDSDTFGFALAAGDFDADRWADLAVGVPGESNGSISFAGAVHVLYGTAGGLSTSRDWFFHQNTPGMLDTTEDGDRFGRALAVGGLNGDKYDDLAIGIPYEDVLSFVNSGAVAVVYGSSVGLSTDGDQFWHQDHPGIEDQCEDSDLFGLALAATRPDVLFFGDFETGDTDRWSAVAP